MKLNFIALLSLFFFANAIAIENKSKLKINRDHSYIKFSIPYLKVSEIEGQFRSFEGELLRSKSGEVLSYQVRITTESIDTNNKLRDRHLSEPEFFNSRRNPKIYLDYDNHKLVLSLGKRKIEKVVEIPRLVEQRDTWNKVSYFQTILTRISLKDFGFKWNKSLPGKSGELLLGDEIIVKAVFQWQQPSQMTPSSKHRIPETKALKKIRIEGKNYKELRAEMVPRKNKVVNRQVKIGSKAQASVYVEAKRVSLFEQITILLGIIGIVGFYLMTRLYFAESKYPGWFIDISFITYLSIYLFLGWLL